MIMLRHPVSIREESRLHYFKKFKAEIIEHIHDDVCIAKSDAICDMVEFLDNKIYDLENSLRKDKDRFREENENRKKINNWDL